MFVSGCSGWRRVGRSRSRTGALTPPLALIASCCGSSGSVHPGAHPIVSARIERHPFGRELDQRTSASGICCGWPVGGRGSWSSGIGAATKRRRAARASHRARRAERCTRALSVAIPVFAYICRYNFEISTNASRARSDRTQRERSHTSLMA